MPRPTFFFSELGGVATHYARPPIAPYGTRGSQYKFYCMQNTAKKLDIMFHDLWSRCPLGRASVITSAGAYVGKTGWHGQGKAFDIDGIFWEDYNFVTKNFLSIPNFYLGVESVLRRHFGTILAYSYNRAHEDHFHLQDDEVAVGYNEAKRSNVLFIQNCLKHIRKINLSVTGNMVGITEAYDEIAVLDEGSLRWHGAAKAAETDTNPWLRQLLEGRRDGPISTLVSAA